MVKVYTEQDINLHDKRIGPFVLKSDYDALTQRNQELELALLKYGGHDSGCVALRIDDEFDAVRLCECGFSKALSNGRAE